MPLGKFERRMHSVFAQLVRRPHTCSHPDSFLLPDGHRRLERELARACGASNTANMLPLGDVTLSRKRANELGVKGLHQICRWDHSLLSVYPMYARIAERMRLLLDDCNPPMAYPEDSFRVCSLGQSTATDSFTNMPTVVPRGKYYLGHKVRFVEGLEAMAYQGIYLTPSSVENFDSASLQDLAGNAFCTADCLAALFVMLVLFSEMTIDCVERVPSSLRRVSWKAVPEPDSESDLDFSSAHASVVRRRTRLASPDFGVRLQKRQRRR